MLALAVSVRLLPAFTQDAAPADRNLVNTAARPGDMMADSPVTFPKEGALPAKFPPDVPTHNEPAEQDYYIFSSPCRSLAQITAIQRETPPGRFTAPPADWTHLPRTRRILTEGGDLRLLALGDSIVNDTMRSGWVAQLQEAYPKARIHATVYVRGGGGCQHYREEDRVAKYILPRRPDLVYIGGISQRDIESVREVIRQLRAGLPEIEILLATGTFGTADPRDAAALAAAPHSGTGAYGQALQALAAEQRCAYLDMTGPWAEYIRSAGVHPHVFYRDVVHANEYGEQILAQIMMALWTAPAATDAAHQLKVRFSWGQQSPARRPFSLRLAARNAVLGAVRADQLEPGDALNSEGGEGQAGGGDVDAITAELTWTTPTAASRKPHSIWQHLLDHGEPGQVARLKDDPGLTPDAPLLTVLTAADGTRGFSIALEQLARHKAMWLPEHDVFVTLAEAPVAFESHRASLTGKRVLDRVKHEAEATLALWTNRWADFGDPTRPHHGQETEWLGTKGHLTGAIARHGSLYKFGVDRWGNVRPDHASPHRFRLDLLWPGSAWKGQRIVEGLPIIATSRERDVQRLELEQFAAPLSDAPPIRRGEVASVCFTRIRLLGAGPATLGFRLATESTNRQPELRGVGGQPCVVDRETGAVWLMIQPDAGWTVQACAAAAGEGTSLEIECSGLFAPGATPEILLKLASPVLAADAVPELAALDFGRSRQAVVDYWDDWLAQGARFDAPEPAVNDLFRANLWHALFLPRHRTDEHGVARIDLPYSNFAYGQFNADWPINQAVYVDYMIYGLRGHFGVAEEEFVAMYHTQQQADGRVGGYADWGVYSPSMLYSIAQNFLLSGDRASFERLLPASLRALDWCLGQVARGQESEEASGLIVAPLNDLTHDARAWAFPNAYFVAGLDVFGRALAACGHPRAEAVSQTASRMRGDVERAFARASVNSPVVQLADGTWSNYVPCDALTPRRLLDQWYPTDVDTGALHLSRLAALDPRGWLTTALLHDHEDNLFLDQWGMANEPVYNQQATAYLRRDEPEAAIRAFYSMMACAFSHRQLTPLEHRWAWGQYYMPPSTDGAWFELYRNMLINELVGDDTLFVGQAVPRAWLGDGKRIAVERAPTYFGPVNLLIESAAAVGRITATLEFLSDRRPQRLLVRLRHPDKQRPRAIAVNGREVPGFDAAGEVVEVRETTPARYAIVAEY